MTLQYKLLIFDIDGTICDRHAEANTLLPGRRKFFLALAEHKRRPTVALATNQGGVGFRHWLETSPPAWLTEKTPAERQAQINVYPTQTEAEARLNDIVETIGRLTDQRPIAHIAFAWQFKSGHWADIPAHAGGDIRWSEAWRKPNPGMLQQAIYDAAIQPRHTLMVSDRNEDAEAAKAAGCAFEWAHDFFEEVVE